MSSWPIRSLWTPAGEKVLEPFQHYDRTNILEEQKQLRAVEQMEPATAREVWSQDKQRLMDWQPGQMALILREFTEEQFFWGGVGMNRKMPDGSTKHYTLRGWGEAQIPCPRCKKVAERTFALADTYGWLVECGTCRDIVEHLNEAAGRMLGRLEAARRARLTP